MVPSSPDPSSFDPEAMFCGTVTNNASAGQVLIADNESAITGKRKKKKKKHAAMEEEEGDEVMRTTIQVDDLDNESKVVLIESMLQQLSGVSRVLVTVSTQTVLVHHDASIQPDRFVNTLLEMKYAARLLEGNKATKTTVSNGHGNGPASSVTVVKSQFYVPGICCASEVPSINRILKPLTAVKKVQINITTKMVYVQHNPDIMSAQELSLQLHGQGFDANIQKDGHQVQATPDANIGRTTLHTDKVLGKHDILPIQQLLTAVGVKRVGVNTSESVVYVEHDVAKIQATTLHQMLGQDYVNTIAADAADEIQQRATMALTVAKSKFVESTLFMTNLSIKQLPLLEKSIRQHFIPPQLRAFYPHIPSKTIKLEHNPQLLQAEGIAHVLKRYGMDVRVAVDGAVEGLALPLLEDYNDVPLYGGMQGEERSSLRINVLLSGVFWFVAVLSYLGGKFTYLKYAGLFSVMFGLPPVAFKAWRTLRRCQFDANCMMVVAAMGALALGEFDEAASVAFLFAVSEYLEAKATFRARKALGAIVSLRPDHANVLHPVTNEVVVVPAEQVPIGSLIRVRTGDKIAADGIVMDGTTTVDESSLTGEAVPVMKRKDDTVSGGAINIGDSPLLVRTTSSVEDSAVSRLVRLVEEAQSNRSPTEKLVDSFAKTYTPFVLTMAFAMCTVPWFFSTELGRYWTLNGLIIIVIACPCALTISTPVTYAAGLAATAQRGVIVKGGASLEALGSVDKVIFDKTGTLTKAKFVISKLEVVGNAISRHDMLRLLALIESPSSHPLSTTLIAAARKEGATVPKDMVMKNHTVLKGEGVMADIDGTHVYAGNQRLFRRIGMYDSLPVAYQSTLQSWESLGGTIGFLGTDTAGIVGAFCVTDATREESREVVTQLRSAGIEVLMLTGDSHAAAKAVARQVGIADDQVHSQLLPDDKLHFIGSKLDPARKRCAACRRRSLVMMVGDGINDAPALAVSDVGVAMGEGASLAMEMADITLMDCNLAKLVYTLKMGTRVVMTIQENLLISIVAKILVVGLTFAGKMTLLAAIASDVGIMLIVTLNGLKLLPKPNEGVTKRTGISSPAYEGLPTNEGRATAGDNSASSPVVDGNGHSKGMSKKDNNVTTATLNGSDDDDDDDLGEEMELV